VPKQATLLEVAGAVFWSFFGVRKGRDMLRDATSIKPAHVVIVGLLAGLAFVLVLLGIVTLIVRNAGEPTGPLRARDFKRARPPPTRYRSRARPGRFAARDRGHP
jgi:hypothetical protein